MLMCGAEPSQVPDWGYDASKIQGKPVNSSKMNRPQQLAGGG